MKPVDASALTISNDGKSFFPHNPIYPYPRPPSLHLNSNTHQRNLRPRKRHKMLLRLLLTIRKLWYLSRTLLRCMPTRTSQSPLLVLYMTSNSTVYPSPLHLLKPDLSLYFFPFPAHPLPPLHPPLSPTDPIATSGLRHRLHRPQRRRLLATRPRPRQARQALGRAVLLRRCEQVVLDMGHPRADRDEVREDC